MEEKYDIVKDYFRYVDLKIDSVYESQKEKIKKIACLFFDCIDNGGIVQFFGHGLTDKFMMELAWRAGALAGFNAIRPCKLAAHGVFPHELLKNDQILHHPEYLDKIYNSFIHDQRDMFTIVSFGGNEPMILELAKKVKADGKKVVAIINKKTYDAKGGTLLEYADEWLDLCGEEPDYSMILSGHKLAYLKTTFGDMMAQMIACDLYECFREHDKFPQSVMSVNIQGADKHNADVVNSYGGRVTW